MTLDARLMTVCAAAFAVATTTVAAEDLRFPDDSGVIVVTEKPYDAKGDGRTDDTDALNRAIQAFPNGKVIVFLPKGTYRISDTLKWPKGRGGWEWKDIKLRGENRDKSIIKLADRCKGYTNPDSPKAMIWTGPPPEQRFHNAVENLTVDAGRSNPGAIGLQFNASNTGRVVDVTIRGERSSAIGLDMSYCNQIGPLLVKNLLVEGFRVGIHTKHAIESQTFYHVDLHEQGEFAWRNDGQVVSIQDLNVKGRNRGVYSSGRMTLIGAQFAGSGAEAKRHPAIENAPGSMLYVRDLEAEGFRSAIDQLTEASGSDGAPAIDEGASAPGSIVREWVSGDVLTLFDSPRRSLHLPIEDTPEVPWDPFDQWANVQSFGARVTGQPGHEGRDNTQAIQKAIDAGKTTVYFPNNHPTDYPMCRGGYAMSATPIRIRGAVRRVIGCEANLAGHPQWWLPTEVIVEDGDHPVVVIERLHAKVFRIRTDRTVVLKHLEGTILVEKPANVFIEDVVASPLQVCRGARVWARQLDPELGKEHKQQWGPHIRNDGGTLWILGLKTEGGDTIIETTGGGKTELLGANNYSGGHAQNTKPMYVNDESSVSIIAAETQFAGPQYQLYVREIRGGVTRDITRKDLPWNCGSGMKIPLYAGFVVEDHTPARAPQHVTAEGASTSSVELTWRDCEDAQSGISHYRVYRAGKRIGETKLPRFVDSGLQDDSSYEYEVSAVNGGLAESRRTRVSGTTLKDSTPPRVTSVRGGTDSHTLIVEFSEPVDEAGAGSTRNYSVSGSVNTRDAKLAEDGRTATLQVSPMTDGKEYRLTLKGIEDRATSRNAIAPGTSVTFTFRSSGSGLTGEYFTGTNFAGEPKARRVDPTIDFEWGNGSPAEGIGADNWCIRWSGQIAAPRSATHTFHATTDDGVRVWIEGRQIIDDWRSRAPSESRGTAGLSAGKPVEIRIEYYEDGGGASCKLEWSAPGVDRQIVPKESLFAR